VREPDGLALSSRNSYLSPVDRERARCLSQGLLAAQAAYGEGERDSQRLIGIALARITEVDQLQYLELRDAGPWTLSRAWSKTGRSVRGRLYRGHAVDRQRPPHPAPEALADRELELVSHVIGREARVGAEGPQPS
jgi:pantoate--beta-alanine ligase